MPSNATPIEGTITGGPGRPTGPAEPAETVDLTQPIKLVADELAGALARARRSPFYKSRLAQVPSQRPVDAAFWQAVPLTTKADLRAAYPFGLLAVPRSELATYHESSGTTGEPTASYFTDADWDDVATRFVRGAAGLGPSDTVFIKTPYSMVTTAHQMHRSARLCGALVVPADNRTSIMPYSRVVSLLRDLSITVAWCLPTEVLLWAAAARRAGLDPARDFAALRVFWVAGEGLSPARRQRMSDIWGGKRVVQDYGSTETGSLAGECAAGHLHFWADRLYGEVVRPGGVAEPTLWPDDAGHLAVTTLKRCGMPLIRYVTGDIVRFGTRPCPCGSTLPTIEVLGRAGEVATVQGVTFFPAELEDAVYSLPQALGVTFWRARYGSHALEVEIDPAPGRSADACRALTRLLLLRFGIAATVRAVTGLVPEGALTRSVVFQKPKFLFQPHEDWRSGYVGHATP